MQAEDYIQQVGAIRDKLLNKKVKDEDLFDHESEEEEDQIAVYFHGYE